MANGSRRQTFVQLGTVETLYFERIEEAEFDVTEHRYHMQASVDFILLPSRLSHRSPNGVQPPLQESATVKFSLLQAIPASLSAMAWRSLDLTSAFVFPLTYRLLPSAARYSPVQRPSFDRRYPRLLVFFWSFSLPQTDG